MAKEEIVLADLRCWRCDTERKAKINVSKAIHYLFPKGCSNIKNRIKAVESVICFWICLMCNKEIKINIDRRFEQILLEQK